MSITVGDNFQYLGAKPLDSRFQFATVAAMKAFAEASLYNGCLGYVTANKTYYTFDSSNSVDSTTGKWRELETGGGGGASALNDLSDVTITSATNGQVLKNNGSGWVNGDVPSDTTKQPKELSSSINIDGTVVTSVENALSTLAGGKQPKTLATPITISGSQYTTVESALAALNSSNGDSYSRQFAGGSTVNDFEADIKSHYYNTSSQEVFYGDFIINYITSSGGVTFTNNCPDGSSNIQNHEWIIYCNCGNPDELSKGNLINITCFSCDNSSSQKSCTIYCKKMGVSATSGSWNENFWYALEGGGGDTSKCYSTDDTAETAIADTDYFPFQDVSASAKRKTLWSNVKSVLKTYFDTLYSGIFSNATELAKIGEQNGVPTYDGQIISLPTVHNFDKANLYSTTEQVIGKWTDGRPLYQMTFSGTSSSSSGVSVTLGNISSYNRIIKCFGSINLGNNLWAEIPYTQDGTTGLCLPYVNGNSVQVQAKESLYLSKPVIVTVQYTKSTDAANSFNYASENDYSTSETIVGTWTDGNTLYQRTYTGTTNSTNGAKAIATLSSGYTVRRFFGTCHWGTTGTNGGEVQLPWISLSSTIANSEQVVLYTQGTTVYINQANMPSKEYKVTIQYTKS